MNDGFCPSWTLTAKGYKESWLFLPAHLRQRTAGEEADAGRSTESGSARGGGSGNGTNPLSPNVIAAILLASPPTLGIAGMYAVYWTNRLIRPVAQVAEVIGNSAETISEAVTLQAVDQIEATSQNLHGFLHALTVTAKTIVSGFGRFFATLEVCARYALYLAVLYFAYWIASGTNRKLRGRKDCIAGDGPTSMEEMRLAELAKVQKQQTRFRPGKTIPGVGKLWSKKIKQWVTPEEYFAHDHFNPPPPAMALPGTRSLSEPSSTSQGSTSAAFAEWEAKIAPPDAASRALANRTLAIADDTSQAGQAGSDHSRNDLAIPTQFQVTSFTNRPEVHQLISRALSRAPVSSSKSRTAKERLMAALKSDPPDPIPLEYRDWEKIKRIEWFEGGWVYHKHYKVALRYGGGSRMGQWRAGCLGSLQDNFMTLREPCDVEDKYRLWRTYFYQHILSEILVDVKSGPVGRDTAKISPYEEDDIARAREDDWMKAATSNPQPGDYVVNVEGTLEFRPPSLISMIFSGPEPQASTLSPQSGPTASTTTSPEPSPEPKDSTSPLTARVLTYVGEGPAADDHRYEPTSSPYPASVGHTWLPNVSNWMPRTLANIANSVVAHTPLAGLRPGMTPEVYAMDGDSDLEKSPPTPPQGNNGLVRDKPPWNDKLNKLLTAKNDQFAPFISQMPQLRIYYDTELTSLCRSLFDHAKHLILMTAYTLDEFYVENVLHAVGKPDMSFFLLLDQHNAMTPSSRTQHSMMLRLKSAGAVIRMRRPKGGASSYMHMKTLLIDGTVLLTGSHNFTKNSAVRCDETMTAIRDKTEIVRHEKHFWSKWTNSKVVDWSRVENAEEQRTTALNLRIEEHIASRRSSW